jgi:DNA-directed RNA polymerase specialized sigma24 family protein
VVLSTTVLGLRQEDVAQALNMPLNTVKTHLRRARLTLAQGLARRETPAGSTGDNDEHL